MRPLSETYAVSPQITPEEVADLAAAGITRIVNNRPDAENPPHLQGAAFRAAAEAAGIDYVENPFSHGAFSMDLVERQAEAMADGAKVLAYCASGNRSAILWAMARARAGDDPDDLIAAAAAQGYDLSGLRPQLEALRAR